MSNLIIVIIVITIIIVVTIKVFDGDLDWDYFSYNIIEVIIEVIVAVITLIIVAIIIGTMCVGVTFFGYYVVGFFLHNGGNGVVLTWIVSLLLLFVIPWVIDTIKKTKTTTPYGYILRNRANSSEQILDPSSFNTSIKPNGLSGFVVLRYLILVFIFMLVFVALFAISRRGPELHATVGSITANPPINTSGSSITPITTIYPLRVIPLFPEDVIQETNSFTVGLDLQILDPQKFPDWKGYTIPYTTTLLYTSTITVDAVAFERETSQDTRVSPLKDNELVRLFWTLQPKVGITGDQVVVLRLNISNEMRDEFSYDVPFKLSIKNQDTNFSNTNTIIILTTLFIAVLSYILFRASKNARTSVKNISAIKQDDLNITQIPITHAAANNDNSDTNTNQIIKADKNNSVNAQESQPVVTTLDEAFINNSDTNTNQIIKTDKDNPISTQESQPVATTLDEVNIEIGRLLFLLANMNDHEGRYLIELLQIKGSLSRDLTQWDHVAKYFTDNPSKIPDLAKLIPQHDEQKHQQKHLINLIAVRKRYLRELEVQAAHYGKNCPPYITLELEDILKEIEDLDKKLEKISKQLP